MPTHTQANRPLAVTTPLEPDALLLVGFTGHEGLSQLFSFRLDLAGNQSAPGVDTEIDFGKLLGAPVGFEVGVAGGEKRHFHGICSRVTEGGRDRRLRRYTIDVVPAVWQLTRSARSRVFQQKTVPDILKEVLTGIDAAFQIEGTFEPRDYCVQYRETDFQFASRLMEEEGIFYFFKHSAGAHKMVVANTPGGHPVLPAHSKLTYHPSDTGTAEPEFVNAWEKSQELRSGKVTLWDHCFELPGKHLEAEAKILSPVQVGAVSHKTDMGDVAKFELYDFPGRYAGRVDGIDKSGGEQAGKLQKIFEDNRRTAGIRMEEEAAAGIVVSGASGCIHLSAGHKFTLEKHGKGDGEYVLAQVEHAIRIPWGHESGQTDEEPTLYSNTFACIPAALPFRPQRTTETPVVHGAQTAVVVGPAGEEICTDKYGRVRVQFNWDRTGKNDGGDTCWVRVGTPWAGKQWGIVHIPRIGQEVIVHFLEGDPDQPIIVGSVYNAEQMPPYELPANKTMSGIKTRSTPKGDPDKYNELYFEDKKGSELVYFRAEKDFTRAVENDDVLWVGATQTIEIQGDRTVTLKEGADRLFVEKGERGVQVEEGDDIHIVMKGDRDVQIEEGDDNLSVQTGGRTTTIAKDKTTDVGAKMSLTVADELVIKVGQASVLMKKDGTVTIEGKDVTVKATKSIELSAGGASSIKMEASGITVKAVKLALNADGMVDIKAVKTAVNGDGMLTLKGGVTMIG